jgi:iron(III) transport system substrate-binding protein
MIRIESLHLYPVKSAAVIDVPQSLVTPQGLLHDRSWLIVNPQGHFLTQRGHPQLARLQTELTSQGLLLRDPQGGDTDQLRGIASGECDIAMSNTYYYSRALRIGDSTMSAEDIANIGWVFPNQNDIGAHMNISGGGVAAHAPNRENAIRFLEYLTSEQAQDYFSAGNDEYPAVPGVGLSPSVAALGIFRADTIDLSEIAGNIEAAQRILNDAGWK